MSLYIVTLMSRLKHPNVIRYYQCWIEAVVDVNYSSGSASVKMPSHSSAQIFRANISYTSTPQEVLESIKSDEIPDIDPAYLLYIAMEYCAEDLWPRNILIDSSGILKIADFGLAIEFADGGSRSNF
ncbi:Eukaryotic translation initiation factor 2 alpha kinase 4 [Orobanche minor]